MDRFNKKVNCSLRVENAAIFLLNTYRDLRKERLDRVDLANIHSIQEVYAICLSDAVEVLGKRGLYKEYIKQEDVELTSPKGRIEIQKSISRQTKIKGKLICSYDELSDDVIHNQIIKSTLYHTIYNKDIGNETIHRLQKALTYFNGIKIIDTKNINFKDIKFNNSNIRYKTVLSLCKTLLEIDSIEKIIDYTFEDKLYVTFKNQLYNFYNANYKDKYKISTKSIKQNEDEKRFEQLIYKQRHLIVIRSEDKALIIDCDEFDANIDAANEEKKLKILKEAVVEYREETNIKTVGAFIHCNSTDGYRETDLRIVNVDNEIIAYTTIDTNVKYKFIEYKLRSIVSLLLDNKK